MQVENGQKWKVNSNFPSKMNDLKNFICPFGSINDKPKKKIPVFPLTPPTLHLRADSAVFYRHFEKKNKKIIHLTTFSLYENS